MLDPDDKDLLDLCMKQQDFSPAQTQSPMLTLKHISVLIELVSPRSFTHELEQEILQFTDQWFKSEFQNKVLDCKSLFEARFYFKDTQIFLKLSIYDYSSIKGIFMPYFTQVRYEVVLEGQRFFMD